MMESGKSLLVSFDAMEGPDNENRAKIDDSMTREISLDYDEDEEMLSDTGSPKKAEENDQEDDGISFTPVDDLDVFAVDETHRDTSGGEIRRKPKVAMVLYAENMGGPPRAKRYMNPRLKGADGMAEFLDSDEQRTRRAERAKRFGLDAGTTEISTPIVTMIDEPSAEILGKLYDLFGIDPENVRHKEKYRLDAIFMRGVDKMSTENIFDFFGPYNPSYLEWIDDISCNVVWSNRIAAARALLGMSKPLRRIKPPRPRLRGERDKDGSRSGSEDYESPLKRQSSSEHDPHPSPTPEAAAQNVEEAEDTILEGEEPLEVDVSQYTIPPGCWRIGKFDKSSQLILMRFATVDDVKGREAHRKSRYYREHGNPNFGGQTGFISRSFMDRVSRKRRQSFEEDHVAASKSMIASDLRKTITDRARWNLLRDDVRRSTDLEPGELVEQEDTDTGEVKLTYFSSDDEAMEESRDSGRKKPRMRMRADEEEDRKEGKRRELRRLKAARHGASGIDGDWRSAQREPQDLRGVLNDARMKITVPNERGSTNRDLRHRLGTRKSYDRYEHDDRGDDDYP